MNRQRQVISDLDHTRWTYFQPKYIFILALFRIFHQTHKTNTFLNKRLPPPPLSES